MRGVKTDYKILERKTATKVLLEAGLYRNLGKSTKHLFNKLQGAKQSLYSSKYQLYGLTVLHISVAKVFKW